MDSVRRIWVFGCQPPIKTDRGRIVTLVKGRHRLSAQTRCGLAHCLLHQFVKLLRRQQSPQQTQRLQPQRVPRVEAARIGVAVAGGGDLAGAAVRDGQEITVSGAIGRHGQQLLGRLHGSERLAACQRGSHPQTHDGRVGGLLRRQRLQHRKRGACIAAVQIERREKGPQGQITGVALELLGEYRGDVRHGLNGVVHPREREHHTDVVGIARQHLAIPLTRLVLVTTGTIPGCQTQRCRLLLWIQYQCLAECHPRLGSLPRQLQGRAKRGKCQRALGIRRHCPSRLGRRFIELAGHGQCRHQGQLQRLICAVLIHQGPQLILHARGNPRSHLQLHPSRAQVGAPRRHHQRARDDAQRLLEPLLPCKRGSQGHGNLRWRMQRTVEGRQHRFRGGMISLLHLHSGHQHGTLQRLWLPLQEARQIGCSLLVTVKAVQGLCRKPQCGPIGRRQGEIFLKGGEGPGLIASFGQQDPFQQTQSRKLAEQRTDPLDVEQRAVDVPQLSLDQGAPVVRAPRESALTNGPRVPEHGVLEPTAPLGQLAARVQQGGMIGRRAEGQGKQCLTLSEPSRSNRKLRPAEQRQGLIGRQLRRALEGVGGALFSAHRQQCLSPRHP